MNSPYTMEVAWEQVDTIIVSELKSQIEGLSQNVEQLESGEDYVRVYSTDDIEEMSYLLDKIRAFETVLSWYTV
jgi:hypothetical protein